MSKTGKYQKVEPKKPLGWKKIVLIVLAAVVVLGGIGAAFGMGYVKELLQYVNRAEYDHKELSDDDLAAILGNTVADVEDTEPTEQPTETTEATEEVTTGPTEPDYGELGKLVNIMLVGQSYREGEDSKLSDTMILCTLNRESNTLTMTSFLRDLYIQLPNYKGKVCGENRINVAYNLGYKWAGDLGGMEMLDLLILNNFGVEVDYNIEIDFSALVALVNKLGGLTIELDADEAKYLTESNHCEGSFAEGENLILGDTALAYARMRKANAGDSDINRAGRQRKMITQIIKQCMDMSLSEMDELLKYILPRILTDMTDDEIMEMAKIAFEMLPKLQIVSNQCPAPGTYWGEMVDIGGYQSGVLRCNVTANKEILMAVAERGEPLPETEETK